MNSIQLTPMSKSDEMKENENIYWSHVCINALKHRDFRVFHYCMQYITDNDRKEKLYWIYEKLVNYDAIITNVLKEYSCPFPVCIA